MNLLRMLTLNISGPSVERAERLLDYLIEMDCDVMVLTETRANVGTEMLIRSFTDAGYLIDATVPEIPGERGAAIVRRMPGRANIPTPGVDLAHRLSVCELVGRKGPTLLGAYVPSRDASPMKLARKRTFLTQMGECLERLAERENVVLLGDLNVIERDHLPRYPSFRSWEYEVFDKMTAFGLRDVYSELHPGVQAHSWIGRKGAGYRYDYAFVSAPLLDSVRSCEYLHQPRSLGISDHAALLMTMDLDGEMLDVGQVAFPTPHLMSA